MGSNQLQLVYASALEWQNFLKSQAVRNIAIPYKGASELSLHKDQSVKQELFTGFLQNP